MNRVESKTKTIVPWMTAALCLSLLTACGGGNSANKPSAADPSASNAPSGTADSIGPVELTIYSGVSSITQEEFKRTIEAPVRAKYPNIKLNYLIGGAEVKLDNMVMTGSAPDIVITSISGLYTAVLPFQLQYDITDLVKKHKYDLSRIESSAIESLRNASGTGALYGLPKYTNAVVLFYNKDIFDKFGVAYPKNGMTWDETAKLAAQMTRTVDGVNYRGMSLFTSNMIKDNQLSLLPIDAKSDKASVNTAGYQKLFQSYKSFYDIVGNKPTGAFNGDNELNAFYKDRNIAMVVAPMSGYGRFEGTKDLNWDIVAAPTFSDKAGVGYQANTIYYFISNVNKKAEQAFLAVTQLLTDEVQLAANKEGRPTILTNETIRATLGAESSSKNKNFKAVFHNKFAETPTPNTKMAPLVNADGILNKEFGNMINNGTDINTMLRLAEEQINQAILDAKSK
ncbi:extracellular solute-binding protein [Paenibacillus hemerocallicola]|uniref:Extracellular solute-binding protein n=1 Tax=Paenibacillus hemerocallicola TaxID=1172614 RepID=A0A5C4SVX9_9BACL|nr:extracellular solute-binding protein [Paenibacillus hemerocallicola]TNJ54636.1 extracellular solute-binding protein [Paenibacillus hemerocallicola]